MTALLGLKISPTGPASNMKECQVSGGPYTETQVLMCLRSCFFQFETEPQVAELQARRKEGELIRELMAGYGISKAIVYRYLNQEIDSAT